MDYPRVEVESHPTGPGYLVSLIYAHDDGTGNNYDGYCPKLEDVPGMVRMFLSEHVVRESPAYELCPCTARLRERYGPIERRRR